MTDITQSDAPNGNLHFSANTTEGDLWMRAHYGNIDVDLTPREAEELRRWAEQAGITIGTL